MRTVTFKSILEWVARRMLGAVELMQDEDAAAYVDAINSSVRDCWERDMWPEWTPYEQRWYRPFWDVGTTYQTGDEVFDPNAGACGGYFRSLFDNQFGHIPHESDFWEECGVDGAAPLEKTIALAQDGKTDIGTVIGITQLDPRLYPGSPPLHFEPNPDGIQVRALAPNSVWVHFRLPPPEFTSETGDAMRAYSTAGLVYYPISGECWKAVAGSTNVTPGTNAAKWQTVGFPYVLAECVKRFAFALALEDDGQQDKADVVKEEAEEKLAIEWSKAAEQQGQVRRIGVEVRRADYGVRFRRSI